LPELDAKMAHGVIRYCDNVIAVLDPVYAGGRLSEILPYARRDVPIVASLGEAVELGVQELVLGAAPPGGKADGGMEQVTVEALKQGLWVVHGMHTSLASLPSVAGLSDRLVELRHVMATEVVAKGAAASLETNVVLTVGSDCAAGKMTTALELWQGLRGRSRSAAFIATGQTGMYISGTGAPIDALRADFVAGVVEQLVLGAADHDYVVVEGQGSILHPAYSGVTLALLHGSAPNKLVFCHDLDRQNLAYFDRSIEDLSGQIELLERLASAQRPARVVGVAAMTRSLTGAEARAARSALTRDLGLPVWSPEEDLGGLVDALEAAS